MGGLVGRAGDLLTDVNDFMTQKRRRIRIFEKDKGIFLNLLKKENAVKDEIPQWQRSLRSAIIPVNRLGIEAGYPFPFITGSHNVLSRGGGPINDYRYAPAKKTLPKPIRLLLFLRDYTI